MASVRARSLPVNNTNALPRRTRSPSCSSAATLFPNRSLSPCLAVAESLESPSRSNRHQVGRLQQDQKPDCGKLSCAEERHRRRVQEQACCRAPRGPRVHQGCRSATDSRAGGERCEKLPYQSQRLSAHSVGSARPRRTQSCLESEMTPRKKEPKPKDSRRVTFHKKRAGGILHELLENMYIIGLDAVRDSGRFSDNVVDPAHHIIVEQCKLICDLSSSLEVIMS